MAMAMMDHHTQSTSSGKFCVIFKGLKPGDGATYNIFIVDLSCGDSEMADPTLEIDLGNSRDDEKFSNGFCMIGNKLFMFEGCREGEEESDDKISSKYCAYALSLFTVKPDFQLKLDKSFLFNMGNMRYPITNPVAIPTPDGEKIVVFSSKFWWPSARFQLFKPSSGLWEPLPSKFHVRIMPVPQYRYGYCSIGQYGFIQNSVLVVKIDHIGIFALDFEKLDQGWVEYNHLAHVLRVSSSAEAGPFFVVGKDRFCFTIGGTFDLKLKREKGIFPLPRPLFRESLSELEPREPPLFRRGIALVSNEDGGAVTFGFLRTRMMMGLSPVYSDLIIDLCRSDGLKAAADDDETQSAITTTVVKTVRISCILKDAELCDFVSFFSIPS